MNVLIFVMTLLMLLSLLTYARLETYRSGQIFQVVFESYMEKLERGTINAAAPAIYDSIKVKVKKEKAEGQKKEDDPKKNKKSNSRISLSTLTKTKDRDTNSKLWQQQKLLLKNLMQTLYAKQPFYLKAEEVNPQVVDDVITALIQAVDALPSDKKLKNASELANLHLADPQLDEFFYKMLHGAIYVEVLDNSEKAPEQESFSIRASSKEAEVESTDAPDLSEEYVSPQGYYSLLDFVTFQSADKIRLYLAPKEVLQAIFPQNVVEDIEKERRNLYNAARKGEDLKALEETFRSQFQQAHLPEIDDSVLDFSLSKVNPVSYNKN